MFTLQISVTSIEEAERILSALKGDALVERIANEFAPQPPVDNAHVALGCELFADPTPPAPVNKTATAEAPKKRGRPRKDSAVSTEGTAAPESPPTVQEASGSAQQSPTADDVKDALTEVVNGAGMDTAIAVLAKFGAVCRTEVKPEDYSAFIAECKAA